MAMRKESGTPLGDAIGQLIRSFSFNVIDSLVIFLTVSVHFTAQTNQFGRFPVAELRIQLLVTKMLDSIKHYLYSWLPF